MLTDSCKLTFDLRDVVHRVTASVTMSERFDQRRGQVANHETFKQDQVMVC
jgi:hypothetical protein